MSKIDILGAASDAQIHIIPLVWTLLDNGQDFKTKAVPIMNAVMEVREGFYFSSTSRLPLNNLLKAVKKDPTHVLAVSLGLFDNRYLM